MTADPRLIAFQRIATAAIRAAQEQGVIWWEPGDDQRATVDLVDGWVIGSIGGHELFRMPAVTLERIASNIAETWN